jgi:hemerythrin-like domain-containing protein
LTYIKVALQLALTIAASIALKVNAMHSIIQQLEKDHSYMLKLIQQLKQQSSALSGLSKEKVDIDILLEIINYIKDFPEHFHHPIEEKLFGLLSNKTLSFKDYGLITKAIDEHVLLDALTELMEIKISDFITGINSSKSDLLQIIDKFSRQQMNHIAYEQSHIFPLCEKYLNQEDWLQVEQSATFDAEKQHELNEYLLKRELISQAHLHTQLTQANRMIL